MQETILIWTLTLHVLGVIFVSPVSPQRTRIWASPRARLWTRDPWVEMHSTCFLSSSVIFTSWLQQKFNSQVSWTRLWPRNLIIEVLLKPLLRFRYTCHFPPDLSKMSSSPANISGVNGTDNLYDDYNGTFSDAGRNCYYKWVLEVLFDRQK